MKAWVLENIGKMTLKDIDMPEAVDDEVLVKVKACGICGSDIPRIFENGAHRMPLVIGHEFAGEYEGKRYGIFPLIPCMKCDMCTKKEYNLCRNYDYLGSRRDGGMAEYVLVPRWNLVDIGDMSFDVAALLEPMAVAVHAFRRTNVSEDGEIVVSGLGTIGMLMYYLLKDLGFKKVKGIGNKALQKSLCEDFVDVGERVPCDVFFEAVGSLDSLRAGLDDLRSGGVLCLVGNPKQDMSLLKDEYWKILRKELTLVGTWNSSYKTDQLSRDDWEMAKTILSKNQDRYRRLVTHVCSMDEVYDKVLMMRDKTEEYIKVMLKL